MVIQRQHAVGSKVDRFVSTGLNCLLVVCPITFARGLDYFRYRLYRFCQLGNRSLVWGCVRTKGINEQLPQLSLILGLSKAEPDVLSWLPRVYLFMEFELEGPDSRLRASNARWDVHQMSCARGW